MEARKEEESKEFLRFIQETGFIWGPEPEIYGGLSGFYTYGPSGKLLKNQVENAIRKVFNAHSFHEIEGPTVLPDRVWKASGHLETFSDPVIHTKDGRESYRVDKLLEENGILVENRDKNYLLHLVKKHAIRAPDGKELGEEIENASLMMKTKVAGKEASLRPETATGTYLPFLRYVPFFRKKLPFAVYQIGKAYRNEISPRQHILRGREFTQAEGQIFLDPLEKDAWEKFEKIQHRKLPLWDSESQKRQGEWNKIRMEEAWEKKWVQSKAYAWCLWLAYFQCRNLGIPKERIRIRQHVEDEKAFYASEAWDMEVHLKHYGWTEVCGIHDRTDYDLKQHSKYSGKNFQCSREHGEKFVPHILEIAFGIDRLLYALLNVFYEKKSETEGKTIFRIPYSMAPVQISLFPLMKKFPLLTFSEQIREDLEKEFRIHYDVSGSIGRRYLRSATVGTPFALTVDYESLERNDVTIRDRDTEKQVRIKIEALRETLRALLHGDKKFEELL